MARGSVKIPAQELSELSKENEKWFEIYERHSNAPKTKAYRDQVKEFLKYKRHNRKPLQSFDKKDINNFIEMIDSMGFKAVSADSYISVINSFARILNEEDSATFPLSWLNGILTERKNKISNAESPGEVLSVDQLSLIKKFTQDQGNKIWEYIFNKLFREGIQLEKLQIDGKHEIDVDIDFINESTKYFQKITTYLKEKGVYTKTTIINSKHFKLSHKAYFLLCPFCKKEFENVDKNWILIRTEYDNEYRLVHAACKGVVK